MAEPSDTTESVLPDHTTEQNKVDKEGNKCRKSIVWEHFTKLPSTETIRMDTAKCNHCRTTYQCHPEKHDTNNMNKHLHRVHPWLFSKVGRKQTIHGYMAKVEKNEESLTGKTYGGYNLEDCRRAVAEFVICDEMPFKVVEGRHFIDEDWRLQKRILNFCLVENHKGETIGREIERCLREWGIERVFTITVDASSCSNDAAIAYLQKKLDDRGGLVCGGKYLHMRCCAHILNLIVNEGINEQQHSIDGIRNAVRYVRSSPQRLKKFKECGAIC
ncbi:hypothetical protein QQ045_011144 [Rhodiola kirilowii]